MNPAGVCVPISAVFPDVANDFQVFATLLRTLSRTDTLLWCARLNLIISNPQNHNHREKQQYGISVFFTKEEIERINRYSVEHGGAEKVIVFFRGQLLELIRWVCLLCQDQPGDGETFNDSRVLQMFAKAALLASDIWAQRVIGNRFSFVGEVSAARRRALASIRQSIAETSSGTEPLWAMGRGRSIFTEHLVQVYPDFDGIFTQQTGLSLDEYYTCLCAIIAQFLNRTPEKAATGADGSGLFDVNIVCHSCPHMKPVFSRYFALESQTAPELKQALWGGRSFATPSDAGRFDLGAMRRRPIIRAADGRAIILDPVFYAERGAIGPLFYALQGMDSRQSNLLFSALGHAFEAYVGAMLQRALPTRATHQQRRFVRNPIGGDARGGAVQLADACLVHASELILFEMKATWISDRVVAADEPERYLDQLREKYGVHTGPEGRQTAKGVGQLARSICRIANGEWTLTGQDLAGPKRLYPVLLVHDQLLDAPVHGQFLAEEFVQCLQPDGVCSNGDLRKGRFAVTPLIIMTIDDLENLEVSLEHFELRDLLCDYSAACLDRIVSLNNFIAASSYGQMMYYNRAVAGKSLDILKHTMKELFPQASGQ